MDVGLGFACGWAGRRGGRWVVTVDDDLRGRVSWLPSDDPGPYLWSDGEPTPPPPPRRLDVNPGLGVWPRPRPVPAPCPSVRVPVPRDERNGCVLDRNEGDDWY